jgi:chemotaxis signal transduction protein
MSLRKPAATGGQFLVIQLGDVRCCIELDAVVQVVSLMALNELPGAPACIKGFFNHGGVNIAVIDLAERLVLPPQPSYTLDTSVVICRAEQRLGGLIVDDVFGLTTVQADETSHQEDFKGRQLPFKGALQTRFGMALWLDAAAVLDIGDALDRPLLDFAPAEALRIGIVESRAGGA